MFYEDTQVIGLEKLSKLLLMSMFGLEYLQMELAIQNCEPNARVISAIKKMTKNPTGANLTEFLCIYKFYCEKIKALKRAKINLIVRFIRIIKFGVYFFCFLLYVWI
ncbi:unnamed protein product [Phyllotreta striolata]|uniref:Uncharacterized protein n=1 Tax=Phyllotreta striolata TaxID=444603 RepID=A0A9N9XL00_PHYSR|nr:unnamed protein product [Phyllotreta striolata]